jgi:hypothetical protein
MANSLAASSSIGIDLLLLGRRLVADDIRVLELQWC